MQLSAVDAATRRSCALNVPRFYAFQFLTLLQLWLPIWVLYLRDDRGLSLAQIAAMEALFWLVIVVSEMPTGALADRWGRTLSLRLSALTLTAAILVFGFATSYAWLVVSYLIWGVSMTLLSGANTAFVYDSLAVVGREGEFRRIWGRAQAFNIGAGLVGSLAGAPLAAATDLAFPIRVSAVACAASFLVALTFHEPPHYQHAAGVAYARILRESAGYTLRHRPLRTMIAMTAVFGAAGTTVFLFTQPYMASHDVPVGAFGLVIAPFQLLGMAGSLGAHQLSVRLGERNAFLVLNLIYIAALLVLGTWSAVLALSMFAVLRMCGSARIPLSSDYITRHSPVNLRATVASAGTMITSVFTAAVEFPLGMLADTTSLRVTFLTLAAASGLLGGAAYLAWARAERLGEGSAEQAEPAAAEA